MQCIIYGFILCAALIPLPARACFESSAAPPPVPLKNPHDIVEYLTTRPARVDWQLILEESTYKHLGAMSWDVRNNEAVARAHLGQYKRAFEILQVIEEHHPGRYRTAANIGTLHELLGHNQKAHQWIEAGIHREPASHNGTEWLHLRILDAKLALAGDPQWLQGKSVSGLDFGDGAAPAPPFQLPPGNEGQSQNLKQIEQALKYQLYERLEFTPKSDPIVADLLFDYGNLIALRDSPEMARGVYQLAWNYGPTRRDLVKRRLQYAGGSAGWPLWLKLIGAGLVLTFGFYRLRPKL